MALELPFQGDSLLMGGNERVQHDLLELKTSQEFIRLLHFFFSSGIGAVSV